MFPCLRLTVAGLACAGVLATTYSAHAQDAGPEAGADAGAEGGADAGGDGGPSTMTPGSILAHYCGDAEMQCMMAPIAFDHTHDLAPWLPDWDTGWIPKDPDELQVRFVLQIPADTEVSMAGQFRATWPAPLTIATPGQRFSGFLGIDYGLIVSGRGKIDIEILGVDIDWEGPLPYVPQIDFHLLAKKQFDAWAFQPNPVSASAFTPAAELFEINILSLAGIPSEIAKGGVALDIKGELQATYHTEKMVIDPSVVPITTENGETLHDFLGGPYVEIDVHPEGHIEYDGIIHLLPSFFVEVVGQDFKMPLYDYELDITDLLDMDLASEIVFDTIRVHVPLPDIPQFEQPAVVDFGEVMIGSGEKLAVVIPNDGEAKARAVAEIEAGMEGSFKMLSGTQTIDPGESEEMVIRFTPQESGKYEAEMTLKTNDPDLPEQTLLLRGEAVDPEAPDYPNEDGGTPPSGSDGGDEEPLASSYDDAGQDGGCGCRTAGGRDSPEPVWAAWLGLTALGLARRRSRRSR